MVDEINLQPGWLARDIGRAQARLATWAATTKRAERLTKETTMPKLIPPRPDLAATYWVRSQRGNIYLWTWMIDPPHWRWGDDADAWLPSDAARDGYIFASDPPIPIPDPEGLEAIRAVVAALSEHVRLMEAVMGPAKPEWQIAGGHNITAGQVTAAAQALGL